MNDFVSPSIEPMFVRAGWRAGRSVPLPLSAFCGAPIFPAAERVVREFSGLHVFPEHPSTSWPPVADVRFDPRLCAHEVDTPTEFMPVIGSRLFPIGEAYKGYLMLFVDERGRLFEVDIVCGDFHRVGESFASAMEALLFGRHQRTPDTLLTSK